MKRLALALGLLVASWSCHRPDEVRLKSSLISPSPRGLGKRVGSGQPVSGLHGLDTPTQIAGLKLWLRADVGITVVTGVSSWIDQSGNGNNFTQATGANQPTFTASAIGGKPGVTATATGFLNGVTNPVGVSAARSIFAVVQAAVGSPNGQWYAPRAGNGYVLKADTAFAEMETNGTTTNTAFAAGFFPAGAHVLEYYFDGIQTDLLVLKIDGVTKSLVNGVGTGVGAENATDTITLISGAGVGLILSEVLVYNTVVSNADAANVRAYLKAKYGTP
jgi:hypothetical protein